MSRPSAADREINRWIVASAVMLSSLMVFLDTAVVNVSLPYIAGSLSATVDESTWALSSYLAATAVMLPMSGWLATYFGRRRLVLASIASFTIASLLCGLSPNLGLLVVFRILQGLTGGVMMPLSQAILLETFPSHERGKAMAFWSMGVIAAPILGPIMGGYLTLEYSWRWVFYVNVPVGIVAFVATRAFIFDPSYIRRRSGSVDFSGILLLIATIGALQLALDKGQQEDWFDSPFIVAVLVASVIAFVLFVLRELRIDQPVVDLRVFRSVTFTLGTIFSAVLFFILFSSMVLLPIFLQTLLGYSPLEAGLAMAPRGLGSLLVTPFVGVLSGRVDNRKLAAAGVVLGAATALWLSRINLEVGYWDIFWPQLLQGCALGLMFVPLTVLTMAHIPKETMGNASSVYNVVRNVGSSVGVAAIATFLTRGNIRNRAVLSSHFDGYSSLSAESLDQSRELFLARGLSESAASESALAWVSRTIVQQAEMLSFTQAFELLALIFLLLAPLLLFMRRAAV